MIPFERETVISWNDAEDEAHVFTCHRNIMAKLDKLGIKAYRDCKESGKVVGKSYRISKKMVKISRINRHPMSGEAKTKAREAMKARFYKAKEASKPKQIAEV